MTATTPSAPGRLALLATLVLAAACGGSSTPAWAPGQPLTVAVGATFPAGTVVRDAYSGRTATVDAAGNVTLPTDAGPGVLLLERDGAAASPFDWRNATVYFVMTDRFQNGDPSNDGAFGRQEDGASEIGTWHGGDLAGLTAKLDYIRDLGATAIWITSPVEQVHGWVAGGTTGDFKHFGYHGYWALDFTRLDRNLGTAADLTALVEGAHARGIRVLFDVVMNHPGYATGADLTTYLPEVWKDGTGDAFASWSPGPGQTWANWNDLVNYNSNGWLNWWGKDWIRAGFPQHTGGGSDDLTKSLTFLPDFITEGTAAVPFPTLLTRKAATADGTSAAAIPGAPVRQYLTTWHADWVRQFGVDGFRCDTAKNVELASWKALKDAATAALAEWKAANPGKKLDDAPFWMTGEDYGHGVVKDGYYTAGGFDSMINFSFQPAVRDLMTTQPTLVDGAAQLEALYASMATALGNDTDFEILSYLSSHDTRLYYGDILRYDQVRQREAGTALLLAPGGVQVFYGDESGRRLGPAGSDATQGTRSDMNWATTETAILDHWRKVGTFRKRHAAVGAGAHQKLTSPAGTYAYSRTIPGGDAVVVVVTRPQ